jgi:hypothetical protein
MQNSPDSENKNKNFLQILTLNINLQVFIPDYGLAKIFDDQGRLISTLQVPAVWKAMTTKGEELAKGVYKIVVNGEKTYDLKII